MAIPKLHIEQQLAPLISKGRAISSESNFAHTHLAKAGKLGVGVGGGEQEAPLNYAVIRA